MPTLREMLEKQKQERLNGNAKPVLQSQTIPQPAKTAAPLQSQPEKAETTIRTNGTDNAGNGNNTSNSMVEQRPPEGLSGIALIRWRREYEKQNATNSVSSNPNGSSSIANNRENATKATETEITKPSEITEKINENNSLPTTQTQSPSQTADNQKTNDGVVDTEQLRRNLTYLANNIDQKELVGQIIRTITAQLKANTSLVKHMGDGDFDLMVRALRRSYTIVARKKSENIEKKKSVSKDVADMASAFKDAGLGDLMNLKI